jgi:hypothetical protein
MPSDSKQEERDLFDLEYHELVKEWTEHVRFHRYYAKQLPAARRDREQDKAEEKVAQAELKEVLARLKLDIRKNYESYDLEKRPTEGAVEETALVQPDYKKALEATFKARRQVIASEHKVDVLEVMLDSLDHRKKALENLVVLDGRDHYAQPRAPRDTREQWEDKRNKNAFDRRTRNNNTED